MCAITDDNHFRQPSKQTSQNADRCSWCYCCIWTISSRPSLSHQDFFFVEVLQDNVFSCNCVHNSLQDFFGSLLEVLQGIPLRGFQDYFCAAEVSTSVPLGIYPEVSPVFQVFSNRVYPRFLSRYFLWCPRASTDFLGVFLVMSLLGSYGVSHPVIPLGLSRIPSTMLRFPQVFLLKFLLEFYP